MRNVRREILYFFGKCQTLKIYIFDFVCTVEIENCIRIFKLFIIIIIIKIKKFIEIDNLMKIRDGIFVIN